MLYFQLLRFQEIKGKLYKNTKSIEICENIEIVVNDVPIKYQIHQIFLHEGGTLDGGHYIILIKKQGKWFEVEDKRNTELTSNPLV